MCQTKCRSRLAIGTAHLVDQPQGQRAYPATCNHQWLPTLSKRLRTPSHPRELDCPSATSLSNGRHMVSRGDDVGALLHTEPVGKRGHSGVFGVGHPRHLDSDIGLLTRHRYGQDARTDSSYKMSLQNYQSCIIRLKQSRAYEHQDPAERDSAITAIVFLGLLEVSSVTQPQSQGITDV